MDYAYQIVIDIRGIDTVEDYPFKMKDKSCDKQKVQTLEYGAFSYKLWFHF